MTIAAAENVELERHFRTEHLHRDMGRRSARGGVVTLAGQGAKFVLQMASTYVLARLLSPGEYGLVGMVTAVTGFAMLFKDLGLGGATMQRAEVNHRQVSTLFWITLGVSIVLAAGIAAMGPLLGWFYGQPGLTALTAVVSLNLVMAGLTSQHQALLRRQMRFKSITTIEVSAMAIGIGVGVAAAYAGAGYWALVMMTLAQSAASMALSWTASGWRPGWPRRREHGVGSMVRYGGNLTGFNALNYLCRNADNVLIGRFIGAAALGIYAKAYQLLVLPINQIGAPIAGVALPALSRLQSDTARWRQYYLNSILFLTAFTMPVVVFTFVCADAVVGTLLGPGWGNAVLIYRLLAGAAFVDTFNVASGWAFMTLGQTGRQFRWQFIESAVTLAGFVIGLHWGAAGVAAGFSIARVTMRFPQLAYCYRTAPVTIRDLLSVLRRPAAYAVTAGMALVTARSMGLLAGPAVAQLALGAALFATLYGGLWLSSAEGRRLALAGWRLLRCRSAAEAGGAGQDAIARAA